MPQSLLYCKRTYPVESDLESRRHTAMDKNNNKYLHRELSWLEFNRRVLEEAKDETVPLLERVKFLAIFSSNLDEFFMIRVSRIKRQVKKGFKASPLMA